MKESIGQKMRRFAMEGWVSKPAWVRASCWLIAGLLLMAYIKGLS